MTGVNPQLSARVPMATQRKAKIKAIQKDMKLGEYITQLIEDDCNNVTIDITVESG